MFVSAMSCLRGLSHNGGILLRFHNHVNLITVSDHHHHHNSDSETLQLSIIIIIPLQLLGHFPKSIPELLRGYDYSEFIIKTPSSLSLLHWHILCQCYSVIIGGYHLGLFTQQLDLRLVFQGMGMHRMIFYFYHMFIPCLRFYL